MSWWYSMLIKDFPKIKTIRYLGNKRRILEDIFNTIYDNVKEGNIVVDLFAGTNCVAYALKNRYTIFTNDIQKFSQVISKALIENNTVLVTKEDAEYDLLENYYDNYEFLKKIFSHGLKKEKYFLNRAFDSSNYLEYKTFSENSPFYGSQNNNGYSEKFLQYFSENTINIYRKNKSKFPYILFSTYFLNGYFGIKQCIQIDSLRYAIDNISDTNNVKMKKRIYLTALIYALSRCVSSVGHFAQYRKINSEETCKAIIKERSKNILDVFLNIVAELFSNLLTSKYKNECWNKEYSLLFSKNGVYYPKLKKADLIYADPPYTTDHYSRYYHVLETLIRHDYPECEKTGRYRCDRYSSNFSYPSRVKLEFEKLIKCVSSIKSKLLISYNNDGLISARELEGICQKKYRHTETKTVLYNHSNQGRSGDDCIKRKKNRKEYLIYCENPR